MASDADVEAYSVARSDPGMISTDSGGRASNITDRFLNKVEHVVVFDQMVALDIWSSSQWGTKVDLVTWEGNRVALSQTYETVL